MTIVSSIESDGKSKIFELAQDQVVGKNIAMGRLLLIKKMVTSTNN